jgi:aspartate aminotransferase
MSESETIAMSRRSRELKAQGIDVVNLSLGEPDFPTPDFIKDAAKQAIDNNFSYYPPVAGYMDLREAVTKKFERDNGLHY